MNNSELIAECNNLDAEKQIQYLKVADKLLKGSKTEFSELQASVGSNQLCLDILGVFIELINTFRQSANEEFYRRLLTAGFSEEFVRRGTAEVAKLYCVESLNFNRLLAFKWRVDISFYDSKQLKRIPVPVLVGIRLGNGEKYTLELNLSSFHKLRFAVALLIKEMGIVKSR